MTWQVYTRDSLLRRTSMLQFSSLSSRLNWLSPSKAIVTLPTRNADAAGLGVGIILAKDGHTALSGVVARARRMVDGQGDRLELVVIDEIGRLAGRRTHPDPTLPADDPGQPARDLRTGTAGRVIAEYVDANAGPNAQVARQVPGLAVAPSTAGALVEGRARWANLVGYCETLALRGGVGFTCRQELGQAAQITFEVVEPQDRFEARFDLDGESGSGSVSEWTSEALIPEVTDVIAGGRGDLEDRLIRTGSQPSPYGRWEQWLDRGNAGDEGDIPSQIADLDDEISDALRDGGETSDLDISVADSPALKWRTHYELGDRVRLRIDGEWGWRTVQSIEVSVGPDGESIKPQLGGDSHAGGARLIRRLEDIEKQIDLRGRG